VQDDGQQCGNEIDGRGTRNRPTAVVHGRQLRGKLKFIAATLVRLVIEKILTHLGLEARTPPRAPARGRALQAA